MFTSELKRLFKNKLAIIVIFVLLGSIGAHLATIFYSPQNQLYKQQLAQPNTTESTAQVPYLSQQIEIYDNYKQDLRATIDNNEKKLDMEIFKDSTLRQSILNENKVLRNLSEIDIKLEKTYAISNVLTSPFIAVVCLILVLFLINSLFVEDLSSNAIMLFKSTQTSNKKHFTTKLLVLISIVTVFMILVFALILMFCMMEGLNLNSPIQLVKEYRFYSQLLSILGALALQMIQANLYSLVDRGGRHRTHSHHTQPIHRLWHAPTLHAHSVSNLQSHLHHQPTSRAQVLQSLPPRLHRTQRHR